VSLYGTSPVSITFWAQTRTLCQEPCPASSPDESFSSEEGSLPSESSSAGEEGDFSVGVPVEVSLLEVSLLEVSLPVGPASESAPEACSRSCRLEACWGTCFWSESWAFFSAAVPFSVAVLPAWASALESLAVFCPSSTRSSRVLKRGASGCCRRSSVSSARVSSKLRKSPSSSSSIFGKEQSRSTRLSGVSLPFSSASTPPRPFFSTRSPRASSDRCSSGQVRISPRFTLRNNS